MLRFRADLYRAAVRQLTGGEAMTLGTTDPTYRDWLTSRRLPQELTGFLIDNALSSPATFEGSGGMWTPEDVMTLNDQEEAMPSAGLLAVGNAINGDFIVIDFARGDGTSGFVSHDLLWEQSTGQLRDAFVPVARSIGEMLHGMTSVEDFPFDYWAARDNPILFDADAVTSPQAPCLGNTVEQVESLVESVHGRLSDVAEIVKRLQSERLDSVPMSNDEDPWKWVTFVQIAEKWVNDMQTVIFDFRRDNLAGGHHALSFARDLLRLSPDRFEYFEIIERIYARMWWERKRAAALISGGRERRHSADQSLPESNNALVPPRPAE